MAQRSHTPLAEIAQPIGQLNDSPISTNEEDLLGFNLLADLLSNRITSSRETETDTFALYGPWGSGKSSLLKLVQTRCEEKVVWLQFDALKYQTEEVVLIPLLHQMAKECKSKSMAKCFWELGKAFAHFGKDVIIETTPLKGVQKPSKTLITSLVSIPEKVKEKLPESRAVVIETAFLRLSNALMAKAKKKRLVIAIDNLDRCRPPAVLELIEAIHLILNSPNTTFVLAMDQRVCVRFISDEYRHSQADAALYLEKMIPDYFRVPDPWVAAKYKTKGDEPDSIRKFLNVLLNNVQTKSIQGNERLLWGIVGSCTVLRNPRRIKRLIRRLSSFNKEWWVEHEKSWPAIVFLTVLSDVWPDIFHSLPATEPGDWRKFINAAASYSKSRTVLDDYVGDSFYEFVLAVSQWKIEGANFSQAAFTESRIANYNKLSELLGELHGLGL